MAGFTVTRRGLRDSRGEKNTAGQVPNVPRVFNVTDPVWGAKGDGVTDDAPAFQAAINAAVALGGGSGAGVIFVPQTAAQYLFKSAIQTFPRIRIVGEAAYQGGVSVGSRIKAFASGTFTNGDYAGAYVIKQNNATGTGQYWHGGAVEHLAIDCNSVAGLGGMHFWNCGENSTLDFVSVNNTGATARTVTDAVTNGTTTVTSATAAFTADDVNALLPAGGDIPANTKIDRVLSATSIVMNNAATGSHSGQSLTINRPADAIMFEGDAPTGLSRSINGVNNKGALLRLKGPQSGSWAIQSLSGDTNVGGNLRVSSAATSSAQPFNVTVLNMKNENASAVAMDPAVLLDSCDVFSLNILGGSFLTNFALRDVVRIDQPVTTRGGPSVSLTGIEAQDPFVNSYTNIIHDSSTGKLFAATPVSGGFMNGRRFCPNVTWNRDLLMGGGGMIQGNKFAAPYGTTVTFFPSDGTWQTVTVTNATAFTIAAPPNPPSADNTAELTIEVLNSSGGAMGAITWNAAFVFPTGAWANPASTKRRFARFEWNGANWICTSVSSADY